MKSKFALEKKFKPEDSRKFSLNHAVWEKNALKFKEDFSVSWSDLNMIKLEIKNITNYLDKGDFVLDAGCSNGYSTFEIAKSKNIKINAFDYSKTSLDFANKIKTIKDKKNRINYYHGNILDIPENNNSFDKVYTIRVIINLLSWDLQKKSIKELHRVLKPGGLYLASEAFSGSLKNINSLRSLANFPPLEMHNFNLYLEEVKFERYISNYFNIVDIKYFSSIYYVASRFLRYLTLKKNEPDSFINPINNFFAKFEETNSSGDFGIQKLYVLQKK